MQLPWLPAGASQRGNWLLAWLEWCRLPKYYIYMLITVRFRYMEIITAALLRLMKKVDWNKSCVKNNNVCTQINLHCNSVAVWQDRGQDSWWLKIPRPQTGLNALFCVWYRQWLEEALEQNTTTCPEIFLVGSKKDLCVSKVLLLFNFQYLFGMAF